MNRVGQGLRIACRPVFQTICILLMVLPSVQGQLRPAPEALARASTELVDSLRADPFIYFRFVNRAWTARVCEVFADVTNLPIVSLHGDAHVGQFALTKNAWGLDDFDDSARGPVFVDIVRYLGSIDLAARGRSWTRDRDALWDRFLEGYRRGLSNPDYRPPQPDIVRRLRGQASVTRAAFLAWGDKQMQPIEAAKWKSVIDGMEALGRLRPDLAPSYFTVIRAGWLRMGVGSAINKKVLIRVQGPTADADDDELLEAKEVTNLTGLHCLESTTPRAFRIIDGTRQLGRLKHDILAVGPTQLMPGAADGAEHWMDWWVSSWEPSYREVRFAELRSVKDLAEIVYDSGAQLGAGEPQDPTVRKQVLSSVVRLEGRLRKETSALVEELLAGWRELGGHGVGPRSQQR